VKPLPRSPLVICGAFVAALYAAMLLAALASPWVQQALSSIGNFPLHRVFSRLTMLGVAAITVWLLLRYGLARREVLGFTGHWPQFLRRAGIGLLAGIVLMKIAILPLFLLHVREWNANAPASVSGWLPLIAKGLGSGIAVALIEETFFRGAMQGALTRIGATRWALFAVPVFYAAVHFVGRAASVPDDEVNTWSGFTALAGFFSGYAQPLAILDAFIALWCVGLLLALVRRRWGDIAGCIGLHAGFVMTIAVFRKVSSPAPANDWAFLVGNFDGLLGWWIAVLTGLACLTVWRLPDAKFRN
jgi:membrane protease YdiL (CAAX protease family)